MLCNWVVTDDTVWTTNTETLWQSPGCLSRGSTSHSRRHRCSECCDDKADGAPSISELQTILRRMEERNEI